ncbi:MAG: hypothetical protein ACK4SX_04880 [Alcanivoracaceae bacterium]
MPRTTSIHRITVIGGLCLVLQGCNLEVNPDAHFDVPAYGWNTDVSVIDSQWRSCHLDATSNTNIRQQWEFGSRTVRISEHRHNTADTTCTGTSTLIWRHNYRSAEDGGMAMALGWEDESGNRTVNGGAPGSQDGLGSLPGQPDIRRTLLTFNSADAGTGTSPLTPGSALRLSLFIDMSGTPIRLFVAPFGTANDADGYPAYLKSFRPLRFIQP